MHRDQLLNELRVYESIWPHGRVPYAGFDPEEEKCQIESLRSFLQSTPEAFKRTHAEGHFTAGAVICTPRLEKTLLTHHRKLEKWLQLGGHADGDSNLSAVALREAEEESGLKDLGFFPYESVLGSVPAPVILDLDVHLIPPHKSEPAHFHFEARYLLVTNEPEKIIVSHESKDLRWFSPEEGLKLIRERSLSRIFQKILSIRSLLQERL